MEQATINFAPTKKQWKALQILDDKTTREVGYGGGAGGGKSYLGCFWLLKNCLYYPGTAWIMGRKELTNLKKTTLITFYKLCRELNIMPNDYFKLDQQINILKFHNGSRIYLMDLSYMPSDPLYQRLGSLELTGAFVDESAEIQSSCITILSTRIGRCKNEEYDLTPTILETFNPNKNHIYYRYYKPYKDKKLPSHRMFIPALVTDNKHIDKHYIEQLRNADEITRQRLLYGNFEYDDDPASLIGFKAITKMFEKEIDKSYKKYITVDVARLGKDKTVICVWDGLFVTKINYYNKTLTTETERLIQEAIDEEKVPRERVVIDEDGVGGGVVDHLPGTVGFINNSSSPNERGLPTNYKNLKAHCYYKLASYITSSKIGIDCKDEYIKECLIQELEQVKRRDPDKDGKLDVVGKETIKQEIGRSPDFSDALMMRMLFEIRDFDFVVLEDKEGLMF